jgi:hypothetical protein
VCQGKCVGGGGPKWKYIEEAEDIVFYKNYGGVAKFVPVEKAVASD